MRQGELKEWVKGYLATAHALPMGPQGVCVWRGGGRRGPQRGKIWPDAPGICDWTSALCESLSEGRRRSLSASPLPL